MMNVLILLIINTIITNVNVQHVLMKGIIILIQFLFVLFIAYLVILEEKNGQKDHAELGKDFCNKVKKDSFQSCRQVFDEIPSFIKDPPPEPVTAEPIEPWPRAISACQDAGISDPRDCVAKVNSLLALMPMRYCLEPSASKTIASYSLTWKIVNDNGSASAEFSGFTSGYIAYLKSNSDRGRLQRVNELETRRGKRFSTKEIVEEFSFMVQKECAHVPGIWREAAFTDEQLSPLHNAIYSIRKTTN